MGGHHDHPVPGSNGSIKVDVSIEELIRSTPRRIEGGRAAAAREPFQLKYTVGLDVGSTTVKAVVVEAESDRSEEHTSELQSHLNLVCRLLLEKKRHTRVDDILSAPA